MKNDFRHGEAIAHVVQRPTMKFVAPSTHWELPATSCGSIQIDFIEMFSSLPSAMITLA